jgi:hypothetical protein
VIRWRRWRVTVVATRETGLGPNAPWTVSSARTMTDALVALGGRLQGDAVGDVGDRVLKRPGILGHL